MKTSVLFIGVTVAVGSSLASPVDDVIIQTMRLADAPNYSWITTAADETSSYTLEGRTETAGRTWLKMPSAPVIAEALGLPDEPYLEAVYLGRATFLLRGARGWVSRDELDWGEPSPAFDSFAAARGRPAGRMGSVGAPLPHRTPGRSASGRDRILRLPGNIQFGLTPPHEELGIIVSSFVDLQVQPNFASGNLSDMGAALLLFREGQPDTTPLAAGGIFRLWFKDARLIRYQLLLEGLVAQGRKTMPLRATTTTTIRDVGTTRLEVPEIARVTLTP